MVPISGPSDRIRFLYSVTSVPAQKKSSCKKDPDWTQDSWNSEFILRSLNKHIIMRRTLCVVVAILVTAVIFAQNDGKARWSPEFSAKAFVSVYHGSYDITAGARVNDNVFGLGSGYGLEYWDAYPANVKKIPVYGFYRRYFPLGQKKRFLLFGEATLGGEYVFRISGGISDDADLKRAPYWIWRASLTPGLALRLFGNTNIYLGPTLEALHPTEFMKGVTVGVNVGF